MNGLGDCEIYRFGRVPLVSAAKRTIRIDLVLYVLLSLAGVAASPAISQDSTGSGDLRPIISDISVAPRSDGVNVEVTFTRTVRAEVSRLEHPDRLVFDFAGCEMAHSGQHISVNRGSVVAVRTAQFSVSPPVARLVIDLSSAQDHEEAYVDNKLVIRLKSTGSGRRVSPADEGIASAANRRPIAEKSDRIPFKPSDDAPTISSAPPSLNGPAALAAYALIAKARALSIPDLEPLETKAQSGDPEAETVLGLAYHAGTLLKKDDQAALRLLQQAAEHGFVAAEEAMGIFCQTGIAMPPDKAQAVSWYIKAAQHGSRDAATNLALMYSTGDGIPQDATKAATWFRSAAQAGDATAQLNLAAFYHRGEGLPQDDAQAVVWLTKAADQGFLPAILELAKWNLRPESSNLDAAIGWYKKAADSGVASAQVALGEIFSDQKLGRLDYTQALHWYRQAADQGDRDGEFGLGTRYLFGQGVPQDLEEARRWLAPAANRGHPYAQLFLAKMLEAGDGGAVDTSSAAKYYELAANEDIAEAQYRLGLLLASDRNNDASLVSAYKWLVLAQESVKESAAKAQELRKLLTSSQITQAEHEIDEWRIARAQHLSH